MASINLAQAQDQKIDLNEPHVVEFWCRKLGCSPIDLRNAVLAQQAFGSVKTPSARDNPASSGRASRFGSL